MGLWPLSQLSAQEVFDCVVDPSEVLEVGSAVDGVVEEVMFGRGDTVRKGDIIARLESSAETAALAYARARAANKAQIEIAQARVDLRQREADRIQTLYERDLIADVVLDEAMNTLEQAQIELRQAELDSKLASLDQIRSEAQLARRMIASPLDGIVIARMVGPGEFAYSQAPVAQLARLDPLHVEVFLPREYYNVVEIGQTVKVQLADPVNGAFDATVTVKDRVLDAASDTFGVRMALPNPDSRLPAGVDCVVQLSG